MANVGKILGQVQVIKNLRLTRAQMESRVENGLKKAGLTLQRESQKVVPVDFGPLKASAFTRVQGKGIKTVAVVGYTASYALFVHEQVGMVLKGKPRSAPSKGKYWDPQGKGQAKFLEEPARRLTPQLKQIIADSLKHP